MNNQKLTAEEKDKVIKLRFESKMSYNGIVRELAGKITPQRVAAICNAYELRTLKNSIQK